MSNRTDKYSTLKRFFGGSIILLGTCHSIAEDLGILDH
jgi:hypothetical protein